VQHPNIDLVQGLYAAYMQGDRDAVAAAMAPDILWHNSGFDATAGTFAGPDAILEYLMGGNHIEDYSLAVTDVLASDTRVAVVATTTGRLGDVAVRNDFVQVIRVADGRVAEVHTFNWDQQALAELMPADVHAHA
jgi:ketosteroid isomerase-like protein